MDLRRHRPHLIILGMMLLTSFALAFTVDVSLVDKAGINRTLPDKVGEWTGEDLLFCQRPSCGKAWSFEELAGVTNRCPTCLHTNLSTCSEIEKRMLPPDTDIKKKRYRNPLTRQTYHASYVLSGKERVSIHRPEQCLSGAGNKITGSRMMDVTVEGRERTLPVKILEMENTTLGDDGKEMKYKSFYAYWFVGTGGRETANHYARMFYMSWDRIFNNKAHRWAYLSVSGLRDDKDPEGYIPPLKDFIGKYYPPQLEGVEN